MNVNYWTERYFQFKSITSYKRLISEWNQLKPKVHTYEEAVHANVLIYSVSETNERRVYNWKPV